MKLTSGAVILVVLLFSQVAADWDESPPQSPANFAGHWVLTSASPQRPGYDQFWLGTEAIVAQSGTTLTITRVSPPPRRDALFRFEAPENHNEYVVDGQRVQRDSRATLSGGTLLISTDTTTADGRRWLSNILRWSFDADGTLVVGDTEICGKGECPSVITTLKFKKKDVAAGRSRTALCRCE